MNRAGLDIIGGSDRQPSVAKPDENFTHAPLDQPDWFCRIKETGKSAQETQQEGTGAGFQYELQENADETGKDNRHNTCPEWNEWRYLAVGEDAGSACKLIFMQAIGNNISLIIKIFARMVGGQHDQDHPQNPESKDFQTENRVDSVSQKRSQYERKDADGVKRRTGQDKPCLYFFYIRAMHNIPVLIAGGINIKIIFCKGERVSRFQNQGLGRSSGEYEKQRCLQSWKNRITFQKKTDKTGAV